MATEIKETGSDSPKRAKVECNSSVGDLLAVRNLRLGLRIIDDAFGSDESKDNNKSHLLTAKLVNSHDVISTQLFDRVFKISAPNPFKPGLVSIVTKQVRNKSEELYSGSFQFPTIVASWKLHPGCVGMEFSDKGDCVNAFDDLTKSQRMILGLRMLADISSALAHLHAQRFIHGDVKPDNILAVERNGQPAFVLCDFDSSVCPHYKHLKRNTKNIFVVVPKDGDMERARAVQSEVQEEAMLPGCICVQAWTCVQGTLPWKAPEAMHGHHTPLWLNTADVWALALTVIGFVNKTYPYSREFKTDMEFDNWRKEFGIPEFPFDSFDVFDEETTKLLEDMLDINPITRISSYQVKAKSHAILKKYI